MHEHPGATGTGEGDGVVLGAAQAKEHLNAMAVPRLGLLIPAIELHVECQDSLIDRRLNVVAALRRERPPDIHRALQRWDGCGVTIKVDQSSRVLFKTVRESQALGPQVLLDYRHRLGEREFPLGGSTQVFGLHLRPRPPQHGAQQFHDPRRGPIAASAAQASPAEPSRRQRTQGAGPLSLPHRLAVRRSGKSPRRRSAAGIPA
jgi:hypothetical protein